MPNAETSLIPDAGPPAHYADLAAVERTAWDHMVSGATSRKSAFHQATVATVGQDGLPQVRTVVLRGADEAARRLRFHTDIRSDKIAELARDPACAVHFYDHVGKIQLRICGRATIHNADGVARALWDEMHHMSRACYRQRIGPGGPVAQPELTETDPLSSDDAAYRNFAAVAVEVLSLEWLYLAAAGHRRARIVYGAAGGRQWLAP